MRFRITRFRGQTVVREVDNLAPEVTHDIVELIWGDVPKQLAEDDFQVGGEMKLHLSGPDWIIVQRTA